MSQSTIPEPSWRTPHNYEPVRLGISSCLLGANVRYDGGHKRDHYLTEVLGEFFEWVSVCPEFEIGLGVPRPTIQLESGDPDPQLIEPVSGKNLTERMEDYARNKVDELRKAGLDGFIFKSRSPSCGLDGVTVISQGETHARDGTGVFARVLMRRWPDLTVVEAESVSDPERRRGFLERVLEHHRERASRRLDLDPTQLSELETVHRALLEKIRDKSEEKSPRTPR